MRRPPARVLQIISGKGIGGAESLLLSLESRLNRDLVRNSYANTFFSEGPFLDALRRVSGDVALFPAARVVQLPRLVTALARHMKAGRFDVVHTHLLHSAIAGHAAAVLARQRLVVTTRHYTEEAYVGKPRAVALADRQALRRAAHVVAVSRAVRNHVVGLGVPECRVSVIYNGIDVSRFQPPALPRTDGPLRIGTVGSLTWRKGHSVLLEAFAALPREDATLTIIGEGPERPALEAFIAAAGLSDRVILAGFSSDVPEQLARMDVYVQPSIEEPFGISILEAMATSLPVIATRTGGIPEIVQDGESGLLVERGEAGALTAALRTLASDAALRQRLGEEGRRTVVARFDVSAAARRYEELYAHLLDAAERQT